MGKYLTVYNTKTYLSVPFERLANGEIRILSDRYIDNEDNCIVRLTDIFHEFSVDFRERYAKI